MDSTLEGKKCLAAIALFGELAKKKLDVYSTLAEFISYCISINNSYGFSLFEIKQALLVHFGFSIPEIIIKNAIKKMPNIKIANHNYLVEKPVKIKEAFNEKRLEIEESHEKILSLINMYISRILKRDLSETEKNDIYDTFFALLIQKKSISNIYSKYISAYIIENEHNEEIIKKLNIIYEGVLIYSAFQYTPEEYSRNTWTENLVLYFDTELLFSLYGLNGKLYQTILEELFDLIKTINKKEHNKIIELRYFEETEQEISNYFKIAGNIVQSNGQIEFQQRVAMLAILNGCEDITQVIEKEALFFQRLKYLGFEEDKYRYYEENDYHFNIISEEGRNQILKEFPLHEKKIDENIKYLNKIAILRKGKNSTRRTSKYFFVTATAICLNIAKNSHVIRTDSVPLTTTVEYLTEKFWIKMNRNFSSIKLLNSNVVIKAQLIIGAQLGIEITKKVNELDKRYKEKNINLEYANAIYSKVKEMRNYSEEVNHDNIGQIIHFTEESINNYINNYNYEKEEAEKARKENVQLKSLNEDMNNRLSFFEGREKRKRKIINNIKYTSKIILLVIFMVLPIILVIFAQINKDKYSFWGTFLAILGSIGALFGICNFVNHFTGFLQKIIKIFQETFRKKV